ncbi:MAG TPA: citrate synthase [Planctomycetota bacterium]|nr:citrate synthase [Planctomycetota bacterium]
MAAGPGTPEKNDKCPTCGQAAAPKTETGRFKAGLEDVVAGISSVCLVDGIEGRLLYRGYNIVDLAENSTFAEVAYLLWYGRLPGKKEFNLFLKEFLGYIELPEETGMILRLFPRAATPMEVLRTAISSLGHYDPDSGNTAQDASLRKAMRLTARIGSIITAHERLRQGLEPIKPKAGESISWNFLYTLTGKDPDPAFVKILDLCLILHADHEWNASTFAARVTAATMSDMYSSVTSAIGTLKGPLHGGANEAVMKMLLEIGEASKAKAWVKDALARKIKISGFGHRVYKTEDPRATVLRKYAEQLGKQSGQTKWYDISRVVDQEMLEYTQREGKKIYPNVDFYSASVYYTMGIPVQLFTPIFAMSRISGWTAHILEQWANNRLIRPRAEYTGPLRLPYVPIEQRG